MAKKVVLVVLTLVIGLAIYFGISWHRESRNTPEAAMAAFMNDLAAGNTDATYARFSETYMSQSRESGWQTYVESIDGATSPTLISSDPVVDRFNVYPEESNPQRFMYSLQVKGRQYWVSTVILKQDRSWKVDDFQGSYK